MLLPKDYVRLRLTGEHAIDVADASGTLLFDVAAAALERRGPRGAGDPAPSGCRRCSSRRPSRATPAAYPSRRARATRRPARSASASTGRARSRSCSAPPASSSPRCPRFATEPEGRVHAFCHAVPGGWHAMGVMLSAAGSLRWLRDAVAPGESYDALTAEAERWAPGAEGLLFLPYLAGERTPHADPDARGAFVGLSLRHDRGALDARRARGRRLRPARLARAAADARRRARGGAASPAAARAASSGCGSSPRCSTCRSNARRPRRAPPTARRCSAESRPARSRTSTRRSPQPCASPTGSSPTPTWVGAYAHGYDRFRSLYPALRPLEET